MTNATAGDSSSITALNPRPGAPKAPWVRAIGPVLLIGLAGIAAVEGFSWWTHGRFIETTNDAYLRADQTVLAPKVSGYVEQVFVADNQAVAAGQPLLRIDPRSYEAALGQQAATIDARRADMAAAQRQLAQQQAAIDRSRAELGGARSNAAFAAREAERFRLLSSQGVETQERYEQAKNQANQAEAAARADVEAVRVAERQAATIAAQIGQAEAQLKAAEAAARSARINVDDTLLRASVAGRVGDKTVSPGQFVQPGTRLMSIVSVDRLYLVAKFKETQLARMSVGQHATVRIDALGGRAIDAVVESFAPGTEAQFALLPSENGTGNFTKVVQRVPVRLRLQAPADLRSRLLPGLSSTVSVDTSQRSGGR